MGGYKGKWKQLRGGTVCGLFLLVLLARNHVQAQTQLLSATERPRQKEDKIRKRHLPERTFVLVGAGDIASCKNPEGARATAKLIEQIPGTVFAAGDLAYEKGARKISRIAMTRRGAALKTGRNRLWAITSMSIQRRRAISNTGERRRGRVARATTATSWETGTLWC